VYLGSNPSGVQPVSLLEMMDPPLLQLDDIRPSINSQRGNGPAVFILCGRFISKNKYEFLF
jgi:hypothetical protein